MSQTAPPPDSRSPLEALLPHWQTIGAALIAAGVLAGAIPAVNIIKYDHNNLPLCVWGAMLSLSFLLAGVVWLTLPHGRNAEADVDNLRILILTVLGLVGFATALFGLVLPFAQYRAELAGGLEEWRKHADVLTWCALAFVGGLVLMFVGLMMGRTYERAQAGLRRLVYGYNAVLTSLLVLLILAIVNVLCYSPVYPFSKFRVPVDWTASGIYTLQPATKNLIASIDQPVKVYVLMPSNLQASDQFIALLRNCRAVNERISWEAVSPQLNPKEFDELANKYHVTDIGVVVVYGTEPKAESETIPRTDLMQVVERDQMGQPTRTQFTGESALFKTLTYLSEGKTKTKIYFTQGNGELDFTDRNPAPRIGQGGIGMLVDQLGKGNYDVEPLPFDFKALSEKKDIPDDADVVVIAGPHKALAPEAIDALRTYMRKPHGPENKKGKLIVMLDVIVKSDGKMLQTGLEPLLREFGVEAGNNHVMGAMRRDLPGIVLARANGRTQIGKAFMSEGRYFPFLFYDARTMSPSPQPPGQDNPYVAEQLILTDTENGVPFWAEEDLTDAASANYLDRLLKDKAKLRAKIGSGNPLSLAVIVSESSNPMLPPGHPGVSKEQTPRLVAFGDAAWISNGTLEGVDIGSNNVELFRNSVGWLRERKALGQEPTKEQPTYSLGLSEEATTRLWRLPTFLMLLGVIALGGSVWVVRRR